MRDKPLKITLDTNTLPVDRALQALGRIPADVVVTSVTAREVQGTKWEPELSCLQVVPETWVMGESPMGLGVLGNQADAGLFEKTLGTITNGSFPKPGKRGNLTPSQKRQMHDAMIFCTHVREGRDVFVTNDKTAFGEDGSVQRRRVVELAPTQVMTLEEFERFCATRQG
jgi:hypothetical protein